MKSERMKTLENQINNLPIGHSMDFKPFMITYDIYRISAKKFELTDTSSGWVNAEITQERLIETMEGKFSFLDLNWK